MKKSGKLTLSVVLIIAVVTVAVASIILALLYNRPSDDQNNPPKTADSPSTASSLSPEAHLSVEEQQAAFAEYASANKWPSKTLFHEGSGPLCVDNNSLTGTRTDCTLNSAFFYKLEGNYRDNGKEIFAHFKSRGFDFEPDSKYKEKTAKQLNDQSVADNLSNGDLIIVDIYNLETDTRVRVSIGPKSQILPYAKEAVFSQLADDQLIAAIDFFKP